MKKGMDPGLHGGGTPDVSPGPHNLIEATNQVLEFDLISHLRGVHSTRLIEDLIAVYLSMGHDI